MANKTGKGGFQERKHQINRKGRPPSFDALRKLAQQIAHEEVKQNGQPLIIDGHKVTVVEAILRKWATSPQHQQLFIEYAFGKVPTAVNMVWEVEIVQALRDGQLPPHYVRIAYPDQWQDFFAQAGVRVEENDSD